ncbi:MAG: hypothetical protein ABI895_27940 [Deltaproteobacteria bacterium]
MKNWKAKLWLAALALLPPGVVSADASPAAALSNATLSNAALPNAALPNATPTDEAPPAVGTLTLHWTISGRRDPSDCGSLGVERFVLSMRSSLADEDQSEGPCDAFQISIDLSPGSYEGDAILVDRLDRPVTLPVPLELLDIVAGREVAKSIDFPVAAFLSSARLDGPIDSADATARWIARGE